MKNSKMYIFFDDAVREYQNYYGEKAQFVMIKHLKKYLSEFSKTSKIIVITVQDILVIRDWFFKYDLFKFIEDILNPLKMDK